MVNEYYDQSWQIFKLDEDFNETQIKSLLELYKDGYRILEKVVVGNSAVLILLKETAKKKYNAQQKDILKKRAYKSRFRHII